MTGSPATPTSALVLEAIGEATGLDPTRRPIPLAEYVDPDALDALFDGTDARLVFGMWGMEVVVHGDGRVVVTPPE